MADQQRVTVADRLWAHEAGMLKGVLESAGIDAAVKGALSTSGEIPAPAASVSVTLADEAEALEVLAGLGRDTQAFVCHACGELSPAGYTECPMCTPLMGAEESTDAPTGLGALMPVVALAVLLLGYFFIRSF